MPKKKSANKGPALVAFPEYSAAMEMLEERDAPPRAPPGMTEELQKVLEALIPADSSGPLKSEHHRGLFAALLLWPLPDQVAIKKGLAHFRKAQAAVQEAAVHPISHALLIEAGMIGAGAEPAPARLKTVQARQVLADTLALRVARLHPSAELGSGDPYSNEGLHDLYYRLGEAVGKLHGIPLSKARLRKAARYVETVDTEGDVMQGLVSPSDNGPED